MADKIETTIPRYPSGNPWPLLDRLRAWLPGASITPHSSNIGADALDALAEIERLRAALRIIAGEAVCVDLLLGNADIARIALHGK